MEKLGKKQNKLNVYFITLDPERDTWKFLNEYLKSFNKRIVGITGESKKIKALAKSWGIHSKKVSSQGENYLIDHTGLVILLDQNGNFSSTIDYKDDFEFIVFCRNKEKTIQNIESLKLDKSRFDVHVVKLEEIETNIKIIDSLNFKINGIVWVAGYTGNPEKEINNPELIKHNYYINLVNPILLIDHLIPKLADDSFISVITSVGGMRGRSKRIFYGSAKAGLINYLSGLRQFLCRRKILVNTVIPGYMSTEKFNIKAPKFLITSPNKAAKIIYKAIKNKKEIVYINFFWKIISFILNLIPEKNFKKLNF